MLNHELAGGALLDIGVYNVGVTQWVLQQQPEWIAAQAYLGETGVDEQTVANLGYANGVVSQFAYAAAPPPRTICGFMGRAAGSRIHPNFWSGARATLKTRQQELTVNEPWRATGFEYQIEAALESIRAGEIENPGMPHTAALENLAIMDRIHAQSRVDSFE